MVLRIENQLLQVAQMGPDFLILKDFFSSPARSGIVTLTVDGESEEIPVHFRASITPSSKRIAITELETADFATTA
ncbi:hypothetical protein FEM03_21020 [Phragmitibacter flavus]|uniref:Uncharacterized protein n=2 Tax=Phragmitibacter flavus TaxID=2576071 RepID=A0A5R8K920_9BACT|nr:hypothetical protein FEM03_21020 [Phragmitibacter flavus]